MSLLQCRRCLLGWWNWPAFEPAEFYDRDYFQSGAVAKGYDDYAALEPGLRRTARTRLRRLAGLLGPGASRAPRILDLGCGGGIFLDEAARRGWKGQGVDASAHAVETARGRGLDARQAALEDLSVESNAYDCVTLWDAIEHMRDPVAVLRGASAALRPGGVLGLSTGDVTSLCARLSGSAWHLFNLPEHLFFFSPQSLRRMLFQAGCRVRGITREVSWAPLSYLVERLRKSGVIPLAAPRIAVGRWSVPATLCDVLGVYAVRR